MKRFFLGLTAVIAALSMICSCSPTVYNYVYDVMQPSEYGVELNGKSVATVYFDNLTVNESLFETSLASSFSRNLSAEYASVDTAAIFTLEYSDSTDFSSKSNIAEILTGTGCDVLFFFGVPSFSEGSYSQPILVYDSLNKSDKIVSFEAKGEAGEDMASAGSAVGKGIADTFAPQWKEEIFSVISFGGVKWSEAEAYAADCEWKKAIEIWLDIVVNNDSSVRAAAEYNIALGCFMSAMPELAIEWLDRADADYGYPCSKDLRARIKKQ